MEEFLIGVSIKLSDGRHFAAAYTPTMAAERVLFAREQPEVVSAEVVPLGFAEVG